MERLGGDLLIPCKTLREETAKQGCQWDGKLNYLKPFVWFASFSTRLLF